MRRGRTGNASYATPSLRGRGPQLPGRLCGERRRILAHVDWYVVSGVSRTRASQRGTETQRCTKKAFASGTHQRRPGNRRLARKRECGNTRAEIQKANAPGAFVFLLV